MADPIAVKCPKCKKAMNVPATLAGKKIRCKGCEAPVLVPDDEPVAAPKKASAPVAKAKPKANEPEVFKLKDEEPKKAPEMKRKIEDDEDASAYGVTADDSHIVRCAFCAKEMDPPNARICKNCGYDMQERRRHASKAVYETTTGEYISHHGTTIGAAVFILVMIGLNIYCMMNMDDWFSGSFLEMDEKDPTTGKKKYLLGPDFGKVWVTIVCIFLIFYAGKYIYKQCMTNWRPTETLLKE
ncbi:hypothetical protein BH11PLA2_BH11PLA2_03840 [soil metagenome]